MVAAGCLMMSKQNDNRGSHGSYGLDEMNFVIILILHFNDEYNTIHMRVYD
jgi:hypothetical protein